MPKSSCLWPNGKRIAVVFNVCLEAWSDGKAPGISPMGNPLPPGVLDTMAISWAAYGVRTGIYRLLSAFARHGAKASVMTNAIIAERAPEAVKAVAQAGHEVLSHSYAMDGPPLGRGGAQEHRTLHAAPRAGRRARNSGLAEPARYIKDDEPKAPGEGGLSLVRRCVRFGSALCAKLRWKADSRYPAFL